MIYLALLVTILLLLISGIHIYWGFSGIWPGKSIEDLIDKVLGRGNVFPSLGMCLIVASVFLGMSLLPLLIFDILYIPILSNIASELLLISSIIFLLRGVLFLIPSLYKEATPQFTKLNLIIYSPLCILISILMLIINIEFLFLESISCEGKVSQERSDAILYFSADGKNKKDFNYISKFRLDHLIDNYQAGQIVFVNGHGGGDVTSISAAINYLVENGVDRKLILFENQSTNTWENIKFALPNIKNKNVQSLKFLSSPYHMDRILKYYLKQSASGNYNFKISWDSYNHKQDNLHRTNKAAQILHEILGSIRDVIFFGHNFTSGLCN